MSVQFFPTYEQVLRSKFGGLILDVVEYGADAGGTFDSTGAWAKAALDLKAAGGGVLFADGDFLLSTLTPGQFSQQGAYYCVALPSNVVVWLAPGSTVTTPAIPSTASGQYVTLFVNDDPSGGNSNIHFVGGTYNLPAPLENSTGMAAWDNFCAFMGVSDSTIGNDVTIVNGGCGFYPLSGQINTPTVLTDGHNDNNRISAKILDTPGSTFFQSTNSVFDGYIDGAWDDAFVIGSAGAGIKVLGMVLAAPVVSGKGATTGAVYVNNDNAVASTPEAMYDIEIRPTRIVGGQGTFYSGEQACIALGGPMRDISIDTKASHGYVGLEAINSTVMGGRIRGDYYRNQQQGIYLSIDSGTATQYWDIDANVWSNNVANGASNSGFQVYTEGGNVIGGQAIIRGWEDGTGHQLNDISAAEDTGGTLEIDFHDGWWQDGVTLPANGFGHSTVRGNRGYNPRGPTTVAVPASGSATAALPYDATFYITQATAASSVSVQGQAIAIPVGGPTAIRVPAGQTLTPTYTTAPTWVVLGE